MYNFEGMGVNNVYSDMVKAVMEDGTIETPRGTVNRELHPTCITIRDPSQRLVTAPGRNINVTFALIEVLWILSGRRDVGMLEHYNSNIKQFSDDGKVFNAAYGYRLRHSFGVDQLADVVKTLKADPSSRQATLVMSKPLQDRGWGVEGISYSPHVTKDRACNVLSHLMIRNNCLDWLQIVRSNDLIWGTPYNWMQFTTIMEWIAYELQVPCGHYVHIADSLHIYDRHFDDAQVVIGWSNRAVNPYTFEQPHQPVMPYDLGKLQLAESEIREGGAATFSKMLPNFWQAVMLLAIAHNDYRNKRNDWCIGHLAQAAEIDPIFAMAQARFYWNNRWSDMQIPTRWLTMMEQEFGQARTNWIVEA